MTTNKRLTSILEKEFGPFTFARFMRATRIGLELSQAAMARKLGVKRGTLCNIEKGRQLVSVSLAVKIARKAGFSEKVAIQACLQDQLRKARVNLKVSLAS